MKHVKYLFSGTGQLKFKNLFLRILMERETEYEFRIHLINSPNQGPGDFRRNTEQPTFWTEIQNWKSGMMGQLEFVKKISNRKNYT